MRLSASTLLLSAGLWLGLVRAGALVRGIEILLFYNAYRLDVEVSAALAEEKGEDPDRSWKIAHQTFNTASDFPGGVVDTSKLGANFHGFVGGTASMGYAKADGLTKIADPWNPTWEEVRDIVKWKPIPKGSQYSYGGFHVQSMLGQLAGGQPTSGPQGGKNHFFDFDNMLAIIGKRCSELAEKKPELARPYMERMAQLSELAAEGRAKESASFTVDNIKEALTKKNKGFGNQNPKAITGAVKTKPATTTNFGTYDRLSIRDTKTAIVKVDKKNSAAFIAEFTRIAKAYKAAEAADSIDDIKKITDLDPQTKDHLRVHRQEQELAKAFRLQIGGTPADACGFPGITP